MPQLSHKSADARLTNDHNGYRWGSSSTRLLEREGVRHVRCDLASRGPAVEVGDALGADRRVVVGMDGDGTAEHLSYEEGGAAPRCEYGYAALPFWRLRLAPSAPSS